MATSDFIPKLVRDARLNDVSGQIDYAVRQGAANNTYQTIKANTQSQSSIQFNVTPPSESVVMDRNILLRSSVKFQIQIKSGTTALVPGTNYFMYGVRDGFKPFPLSSTTNNCTLTINTTSVSINLQDVLPALLRTMDQEKLAYFQGMTPIMLDNYKNYSDAIGKNNNPLGGYGDASYNSQLLPRGVHPLTSVAIRRYTIANVANFPNGAAQGTDAIAVNADDLFAIDVEATFVEPVFISPFTMHSEFNQAGILGVNNFNLNYNIDSTLKQFWASALPSTISYNVVLRGDSPFNAELLLNYLSTQATNLLPARNVVPFYDFPRFITSSNNSSEIASGVYGEVILNSIQLNQIPDKIYVIARKPLNTQSYFDTSTFLPIDTISVNFNNSSGLLSSANQQDLWRASVSNGSKQSWYAYSGKYGMPNAVNFVYSEGSVLVLDCVRDFGLPEYLSNGSIGQFSLQMRLKIFNPYADALNPEIVVIVCNAGLFSTIAGSSSVQTALLNMDLVSQLATTSRESAISSNEISNLSGGAISDQVASALKNLPLKGKARSGGMHPRSKLDMLC